MTRRKNAYIERVLTENAPALLGFFIRRINNPSEAADLVGETVLAAWRVSGRIPIDDAGARMWLFGVARNVLMHHARSTARRDALTTRLADAITQFSAPVETGELVELRVAVNALPADLAEIVRLVHWDGFSVADAAIYLGVSSSTLRSRHLRAKQLLRAALIDVPATDSV